jgi:hypothetical protein
VKLFVYVDSKSETAELIELSMIALFGSDVIEESNVGRRMKPEYAGTASASNRNAGASTLRE